MKTKPTQMSRTKQYIEDFGSITRVQAMNDLGIANLPAVINILRKQGVNVITNEISAKNRYGEKITYAKYTIEEGETND